VPATPTLPIRAGTSTDGPTPWSDGRARITVTLRDCRIFRTRNATSQLIESPEKPVFVAVPTVSQCLYRPKPAGT
jgi:hypothetical protein